MKPLMTCAFLAALFLGISGCSSQSGSGASSAYDDIWMTDMAAASATARENGKYLLLNFTGSDWCGWCIKLKKEVLATSTFHTYASGNLVPVELDFPNRKKIPDETRKQNEALAEKYGIRGYPTLLILSPEGELVEQTGYRPGGADAYVEHLRAIIDRHKGS